MRFFIFTYDLKLIRRGKTRSRNSLSWSIHKRIKAEIKRARKRRAVNAREMPREIRTAAWKTEMETRTPSDVSLVPEQILKH